MYRRIIADILQLSLGGIFGPIGCGPTERSQGQGCTESVEQRQKNKKKSLKILWLSQSPQSQGISATDGKTA